MRMEVSFFGNDGNERNDQMNDDSRVDHDEWTKQTLTTASF